MSYPAKCLLFYLARYLEEHPARRPVLMKQLRKANGGTFHMSSLWRHTKLQREPTLSHSLVYLAFLFREKALLADPAGKAPFLYAHDELRRARKK